MATAFFLVYFMDVNLSAAACVRSVMFDNNDEEYPYSTSGTCFLANYGGRRYVITAHHCVENRTGEELQVHADEGYQDGSVPLDRRVDIREDQDIAPMATDLAVFRLSERAATEEQRVVFDSFCIEDWYPKESSPGDPLLVIGYPKELKEIDYAQRSFKHKRVIASATYLKDEGNQLHWLELDICGLQSPQGLSGAPVFAARRVGGELVPTWLSGVIVETTVNRPWKVRFVCTSVLFGVLRADAQAG